MRSVQQILAIATLWVLMPGQAAASLVVNGDFEQGDVGFTSDYATFPMAIGVTEATYQVLMNPSIGGNPFAASYGDHTSGSGFMLAVNGAPTPNQVVWGQTITVSPFTTYDFAAYLSSWFPANPAQLEFSVNGTSIGSLAASETTGVWELFFATWTSDSSTTALIEIVNSNTTVFGNDFALDDIYFGEPVFSQTEVPEPTALAIWGIGAICMVVGAITNKRRHMRRHNPLLPHSPSAFLSVH